MKVLLTQSPGRLEGLAGALAARGHQVVRRPLIDTRPRLGPGRRAAAAALLELPWLLFSSRSAVEAWRDLGLGFAGPRLGAVGARTAEALETAGADVSVTGSPQTAAGLAAAFLARPDAVGPVGLPLGDRARRELPRALRAAGLEVRTLVLYETVLRPWPEDHDEPADVVVLASPSAASALPRALGDNSRLVTLGPSTSAAVRDRGWEPLQAAAPDKDALLALLEQLAPLCERQERP